MSYFLGAVVGKPVLHSLSPTLHRAALRDCGIDGCYIRLAADSAHEAVKVLREMGARGCNITAPFKSEAFEIAEGADEPSERLQAANTLILTPTAVEAFNTDVAGVRISVEERFPRRELRRAVIVGTGGAARAAALALSQMEWEITVVGRNSGKLSELAKVVPCNTATFDGLQTLLAKAALLVSCITSDELLIPVEMLHPGLTVFDATYGHETKLLRAARERGLQIIPGISWLLHQGCRAFTLFTDTLVDPEKLALTIKPTRMIPKQSIALIGCMGSGKTTIAKRIAAKLGRPLVDLDEAIEAREGCSISEIFANHGESYFRECESEILRQQVDGAVIACGGGVVLRRENRELLTSTSLNVWLWASAAELSMRLANSANRPLLKHSSTSPFLESILTDRLPLYAELSDLVVPTEGKSPESITERICYEIHSTWSN